MTASMQITEFPKVNRPTDDGPRELMIKGMLFAFKRIYAFTLEKVAIADLPENKKEFFKAYSPLLLEKYGRQFARIFDTDPFFRGYNEYVYLPDPSDVEMFPEWKNFQWTLSLPTLSHSAQDWLLSFEGFCRFSMACLTDSLAEEVGKQWMRAKKVWESIQLSKQEIASVEGQDHILFHFDPLYNILLFLDLKDLCAITLTCKTFYLSVGLLEWKNHIPSPWGLRESTDEAKIRTAVIFAVFLRSLNLSAYCEDLNDRLEKELKDPKGIVHYYAFMNTLSACLLRPMNLSHNELLPCELNVTQQSTRL